MDPLLIWLEATPLSVWMREDPSIFAFPMILSLHTIGMAFAAGLSIALDLRILGVAARVPVTEMRRFLPVIWAGFSLNALSGVILLIGYPTKALTNPVFFVKLACVAFGIATVPRIARRGLADLAPDGRPPGTIRLLAVASIASWMMAITTGRLLAYTYTRLTAL